MAIFGLLQGLGIAIIFGSWGIVTYIIVGGILWDRIARPWEEAVLADQFGEEYQRYREKVRCWVPGVTAYAPTANTQF